jgi:hypothetical protein
MEDTVVPAGWEVDETGGGHTTPPWIAESLFIDHIEDHMEKLENAGYGPFSGIYLVDFPAGKLTDDIRSHYMPLSAEGTVKPPYPASGFSISVRGPGVAVKIDDCGEIKDVGKALKSYFSQCKINGSDYLRTPFFIGFSYQKGPDSSPSLDNLNI